MMINKPTRLGSILVAVLLMLMPAQPLLASVAILNVQPGPGGKPTVRSVTKETVTGDRFETNEKEIQQVLLSDGTSLTLGPGSALVIESFTYDPQTQSGQLNVRLERGQFRVVGGLLNNTGNIAIQTPSGKLDLDNASAFVEVQSNGATRASLLHGKSLKMTTNGKSETVERPAFEVVSAGANQPIKTPSHQDPKMVAADALALNSQSLLDEQGGGGVGDPGGQGTAVLASLSATGSETPFTSGPLTPTGNTGTETPSPPPSTPLGPPSEIPSAPPSTPPPPEPPFTRPGLIDVALNPSTGFGPGNLLRAVSPTGEEPSQANNDQHLLAQVRENATVNPDGTFSEPTREKGRTTNRLFNSSLSEPFTQVLSGDQKPVPVANKGSNPSLDTTNLAYVFFDNRSAPTLDASGLSLAIVGAGINLDGNHIFDQSTFLTSRAPFLLVGIREKGKGIDELPEPNKIFEKTIETNTTSTDGIRGSGSSIFKDATHFKILQAGFSLQTKNVADQDETFVQRDPDNFLLVEVRPGEIVGGEPQLDPTRTERYLFATGDVDGGRLLVDGKPNPNFTSEFSVDRYFISPGLAGFEEGFTTNTAGKVVSTGNTVASSIRAFLRNETKLGMPLTDTGLYVINPKSSDPESDATLLHADFGLDGNGANQKSTISVTLGKVDYKLVVGCPSNDGCDTKNPPKSYEAVVSGRTIGSSHDNTDRNAETGLANASGLFSSRLDSTAAGGGNPLLPVQGRAGYFVLENVNPDNPDYTIGDSNSGGFEKPLDTNGGKSDIQYAYLRLATAIASSQPTLRNESALNGWMGGLAEFQNGNNIGLTQLDSGDTPSNVEIQTSPTNNTVAATFTLFGQDPAQSTTFNIGGLTGNGASAFVDDNRFAARSANGGSEVAMVTADLFRDANGNLPPSLNRPDGTSIPQYEHLKWGFFFGDTKTTPGQREHVHLGTWIAGKIPTGDSLGLKGQAMYTGHSIGNVFNNGSLYTAVGSFQNQWDFDKRTGTVQMDFDKMNYTGATAIKNSSFNFDGTLSATGRTGQVQGSFVAPVNPTPAAVMGGFSIKENQGGPAYRAAGTFGAERK
jgi:hypothetical protein